MELETLSSVGKTGCVSWARSVARADCLSSFGFEDLDDILFGELVPDGQQHDSSWVVSPGVVVDGMESLFAGFCEPSTITRDAPDLFLPAGAGGAFEDSAGEDIDGEIALVEGEISAGPSGEELAIWRSAVVTSVYPPTWRSHTEGRFQSCCFAVEWRDSVLVDKEKFIDDLFGIVGGDASFVLGTEVRQTRADYLVVVRITGRVRWRDWRKALMFGHAGDGEEEGLYMRVRVPRRGNDDGIKAFAVEMKRKCETYNDVSRYHESRLVRVQDKGYKRPGRSKKETSQQA